MIYNNTNTPLMSQLIPNGMRVTNQASFDSATTTLTGQCNILSKIRTETTAMRSRFVTMIEILAPCDNIVTVFQKALYDAQIRAFLHTMFMYAEMRNGSGGYYVNPVTVESTTTPLTMTVQYPSGDVVDEILVLDNVSIDIANQTLYIGSNVFVALNSTLLEQQYGTLEGETYTFTKDQFITGVSAEMIKLMRFNTIVCKNEMKARSGIRYVSELKSIVI